MKLRRLSIHQLPGISPGFSLQGLDAGVNLITGPNAVGKSSLVRALRYLLGGVQPGDPPGLALEASLANGGTWTVRRNGSQLTWEQEGQRVDAPPLPDASALHCYWLTMEDLVRAEQAGDEQLIAYLRQSLAGGYDLESLRQGDFQPRPQLGQREARELREAREARRRVEQAYHQLLAEERQLPELDRRIHQARQARERLTRLEAALRYSGLRERLAELDRRLQGFPPAVARLRGDEGERLTRLDRDLEELRGQETSLAREQERQQRLLESTGLAERKPDPVALRACRADLEQASEHQLRIEALEEAAGQHQIQAEQALQALGGSAPGLEERPRIAPETLSRAESLAREIKQQAQARDQLQARREQAPDSPEESELQGLEQGIQALRRWLAARDLPRWPVWLAGLLGLSGAGPLVVWATMHAHGWLVAAGILALAGALSGVAGAGWRLARMARRDYEGLGLEPVAQWQLPEVRERLSGLQDQLARRRLDRERATLAAEALRQLEEVKARLQDLLSRKDQLAGELGFDPELTALGFDHFVRQVDAWQGAERERAVCHQALADRREARDSLLRRVADFVRHWSRVEGQGRETLAAALDDLEERTRQADSAHQALQHGDQTLAQVRERITGLEKERTRLFEDLGLNPSDRSRLHDALERLPEWQRLAEERRTLVAQEQAQLEALAGEDELTAMAEDGRQEQLEARLAEARDQARGLDDLQDERSRLLERLAQAGRDQRLEQALAEEDQKRCRLQDQLDSQLFAEAGQFLLEEVEQEHRTEQEPAVLQDARARFAGFTHHAWDLVWRDERLMAWDCRQESLRPLGDLSSGTRMQLLLAVRLAWARHLERGCHQLPLFLDEALTTSDEQRFGAVARSLQQLADEEDRQLFYLSARRQELALWEAETGRRPPHWDLARVRFGQEAASGAALQVEEPASLPPPDGQDPVTYARLLDIPPVDPWQEAGSLALFHLLRDDLPLLHRLMQDWRLSTLGQLEAWLGSDVAGRALEDQALQRKLEARCRTARTWIQVWRQGRGKPVDRGVLEASGAVSSAFIDKVSDLAESLGGDAEALVAALNRKAVSGFRAAKIEQLKEWLEVEGYISPEPVLEADERERQTLQRAGAHQDPADVRRLVAWLEGGVSQ